MDTIKTAFMPNTGHAMCIDGGIPPTSHFCPMCGQQFERAQFIVEHMQVCHSVITGIGNPGLLLPTQTALGRQNQSASNSNEDAPQTGGVVPSTTTANTGSSFLARCMACGIYGISTATLQQGSEYKCLHCGTVCTAGQPTYLEPNEDPHTPDDMPSIPPTAMNSYGSEQNRQQHHRTHQPQQHDKQNHHNQQQQQKEDALKVPPLTVKLSKGGEGQPRLVVKQETVGENGTATQAAILPLTTKPRNKCPDCPKTFKTAGTLSIHRKVHTGEPDEPKQRPFTCTYCSKAFTQSNTLKQHTRIHTGEKPYHCGYCEKSFSVKDYLTKHIRTHTGEKPYTCPYCNKNFTQRSALTVHTNKLHPL